MKVVILAGGVGTRLAEETELRPKPMVEIGGMPILCHIMKHYAHYGFNEFIIALGYKGEMIKRYILDYWPLHSDITVRMRDRNVVLHGAEQDDWTVQLVDTGQQTLTAGRIGRLRPWLDGGTFMCTFGDGVSDVNLHNLLAFHRSHRKLATLTAVRPPARFGHIDLEGDQVVEFSEKPQIGEGWINGGFYVLEPDALDYIEGDHVDWAEAQVPIAKDGQLMAFRHDGFWQCMDTLRDRRLLENLWNSGHAPWKVWS